MALSLLALLRRQAILPASGVINGAACLALCVVRISPLSSLSSAVKLGAWLDEQALFALLKILISETFIMESSVLALGRQKLKVVRSIIRSIVIAVVYYLVRFKTATQDLFHDFAVFKHFFPGDSKYSVAPGNRVTTFPKRMVRSTSRGDSAGLGTVVLAAAARFEGRSTVFALPHIKSVSHLGIVAAIVLSGGAS
jgi:hypothetical protein